MYFKHFWRGAGLTETGGFYLSGGGLNFPKKKVSVLHNELESKVQEVGGHAAKEKNIRPQEVLQSQ